MYSATSTSCMSLMLESPICISQSSWKVRSPPTIQSMSEHQWNTTGIRVCVYIPWNISIHSSKLQFLSPGRGTSVSPNVTPPSTPKWNCRFIITIGIRSAAIANIQENGNCLQICRAHKWHHQIYINICNSIILLVFYVASPSQPHNSWDGFSIEIRHSMTLFMGKYGSHMTNKNHMEFPVVSSRKIGRFSRYQRPRMSPPVPSAVPRSAPHLAVTTWNDMKRPLKTSYPAW